MIFVLVIWFANVALKKKKLLERWRSLVEEAQRQQLIVEPGKLTVLHGDDGVSLLGGTCQYQDVKS
jgi:hypothetical protein